MNKTTLRKTYKSLRKNLVVNQIEDFSLAIANKLLELDIWQFEYYHLFLTISEQNEINTEYILNILSGKDKHIVLSKSNFKDLSMEHYLLTDSTRIIKNSYNIPEPVGGIGIPSEHIDVVFVPLLAFDIKGNRIGYGKGFYDRFLSECKPGAIKIGLSFFEAEENIINSNKDDIPLDFCVTPKSIYKF